MTYISVVLTMAPLSAFALTTLAMTVGVPAVSKNTWAGSMAGSLPTALSRAMDMITARAPLVSGPTIAIEPDVPA